MYYRAWIPNSTLAIPLGQVWAEGVNSEHQMLQVTELIAETGLYVHAFIVRSRVLQCMHSRTQVRVQKAAATHSG